MMKKLKYAAMGFLVGSACTIGTAALAESGLVSATLVDNVRFYFTDTQKSEVPPEEFPVLIYNDRVYTSARFVGEALGAEVSWNNETREVVLTKPEPEVIEKIVEVEVEKIVEVPVEKDTDNGIVDKNTYQTIPVTYRTSGYSLEIVGAIHQDNGDLRILGVLTCRDDNSPVCVQLGDVVATLDGNPIKRDLSQIDTGWYNYLTEDGDEYNGNIVFGNVSKDAEKLYLEIPVVTGGYSSKTDTVKFYIKLK